MRKSKKLLSLALASLMTVSSFACLGSVSAFAAEGEPETQVLKGDVNKDGVVDVVDATLIQLYAVEDPKTLAKFESGEYSAEAADFDGSGYIDITDATLVQIKANEPTTTAPVETTAEPTTEPAEPTTVEPTTEPVETTAEPTTAPAEDVYVLAGTSDWLTVGWDPAVDAYVMTKQDDGTYAITVEAVAAADENYSLKVVKFVGGDEAQKEWFGVNGGNLNYDFLVEEDCDVTVTYNPETKEIKVTGIGVADPEYPINKIVAVGSGQNGFLNDESWAVDSEANTMTEKGEGVYEIVYDEVEANAEYQVKFAANGSWNMNWGLVKGTEAVLNEANPAQYNAEDNIVFMPESEDEYVKITLTLDLSKWDKITKEGATYTITVESGEEPTTAEPTTVEPTTEPAEPTTAEPTTVEPTTEPAEPTTAEPTTAEPTTAEPTTEPVAEDVYVLAGTSDWLTVGWDPAVDAYVMTKQDDGTYAITVEAVAAADENYSLKVVKFVGGDEAQKEWFGVNGGNLNYDFLVEEDCDVTVTYNPETKEIKVTGIGVADPEYPINKIVAVGSGQNGFLNDESWAVDSEANTMTEKCEGVYEIVYDEVEANAEYQVKFAANGSWGMNWGLVKGTEAVLNEATPAQYNAEDNIVFMPESEDEYVKITLTLDLTNWDKITKEGATYTITVESCEEPTTAEPTTVEPTTEPAEPTTAEPTTVEPITEPAEPTTAEPTTVEPTTAEPTTVEPTTAEPTTAEPTTVEPTTAPVEPTTVEPTTVEPTTEPADEDVYVLAGSSDWLTVGWDPAVDAYVMTKQDDGSYAVTVEAVPASDANYAVKVVKFVGGDAAQKEWYGVNGGNLNYDFMVKEDCDVTVTYNPETKEIKVTGAGVADPEYPINKIVAVGSGQNGFLNDEAWNVDSEYNTMDEEVEGVYTITFDEVEANVEYQVKFAANGSWGMNWGAGKNADVKIDEANDAEYNAGDNIIFMPESESEYVTITLTLDLSNWDRITKEGATYKINVVPLD
ncbi:MAG: dockerin type I domain-containing protein [Ruminococcus sp.]